MKKITLLAALYLAGFSAAKAQHVTHGAGLGVMVDNATNFDTNVFSTISYSPNFHFGETANSSFSVGVPLSLGLGFSSYSDYYVDGYGYDDLEITYMINVPVMFNYNFGAGSSRQAGGKWGFFAGAGYAFHYGTTYGYIVEDGYGGYDYSEKGSAGPAANAGFRIAVGARRRHNIEVRFSYMKGLTEHKPNVMGATCYFNF